MWTFRGKRKCKWCHIDIQTAWQQCFSREFIFIIVHCGKSKDKSKKREKYILKPYYIPGTVLRVHGKKKKVIFYLYTRSHFRRRYWKYFNLLKSQKLSLSPSVPESVSNSILRLFISLLELFHTVLTRVFQRITWVRLINDA